MRPLLPALLLLLSIPSLMPAAPPPVYLWFEPEWFDGVQGSFAYWTGDAKPTGSWGVAGPGISPEWTQGGESEWNSMGAAAAETKASCHREFTVPRAGKYKVWVRYVDHRKKTEPFTVTIRQGNKAVLSGELGVQPVVPVNDEYQLYWGFSFGWGAVAGNLTAGPAQLLLTIDKPGQAWRQVDAVLITDDPDYTPVGREKPPFAYRKSFALQPKEGASWRGSAKDLAVGASWKRAPLAGRDFTMWATMNAGDKGWDKQKLETLNLYDAFFQFSPPNDIRDKFHKQFAGRKDLPIVSWPHLRPGLYLKEWPNLSPGTPLRQWLERTKTPFFIITNYPGNSPYTSQTGPATYHALTGPLAGQFLGYINGESIAAPGGSVALPDQRLGKSRREHIDAMTKQIKQQEAATWSKFYKTAVPESHWAKNVSCLSVNSLALAHQFHETGSKLIGYETDSTMAHVPLRIAFDRGAARQYGGQWLNYASANFGDACTRFGQKPSVPRGAPCWFHSKYAITDGVSIGWYRKLYYLNYLGGASAIFWEQALDEQFFLPGPGTHPVQLSPFGRATEDFMAFVDRLPDRGEPYTPIALLLSYGHSYECASFKCKMLDVFTKDKNDIELRELFNVAWHPSGVVEGQPAMPEVPSMPSGVYGDIFDVLVDRPSKAKAILDYPIVWAAGDVKLDGQWLPVLDDYLKRGGTLVVNIEAARGLPAKLLGLKPTGKKSVAEEWSADGAEPQATTPFEVEGVTLDGAKVLAWATPKLPLITRNQVGAGAVIVTLCPHLIGQDERAHPALPYLMNGLTTGLLPVEVRRADGQKPQGEIMYQVNRTKDGYLVALVNNGGVDKTQNGVARVNRRAFVDVLLRTKLPVKAAKEYTGPRELTLEKGKDGTAVRLRVHPGDVQVVYLMIR